MTTVVDTTADRLVLDLGDCSVIRLCAPLFLQAVPGRR